MEAEKKFCRDCKYLHLTLTHFCSHPLSTHPVTGDSGDVHCNTARLEPNNVFFCGPDGKYWKEKETS
jgi:hypothetical protein